MPEVLALASLSIKRHQTLMSVMVSLILLGLVGTLITLRWFGEEIGIAVGGYSLFFTLLPSGIAGILLFDYGLDQDLSHHDSGCSHWVLRLPIQTWKIAAVPIIFKSAWISLIWLAFAFSVQPHTEERLPIVLPCLSLSGVLIWIMVLSWRPFTSGRHKTLALIAALPISYVVIAGGFVAPSIENETWQPHAVWAIRTTTILFYGAAVLSLIHATHLARTSPDGMRSKPDHLESSVTHKLQQSATRERNERIAYATEKPTTSIRTVIWHDSLFIRDWVKQVYVFGVIPGCILYPIIVPLNPLSVAGMFFGVIYCAGLINSKQISQAKESGGGITRAEYLPSYLATKPIQTKEYAWGRQVVPLTTASLTYLWVLVVIAGWSMRESNRKTWTNWAASMASQFEQPHQFVSAGIQFSIAIVLGVGILFITRMMAYAWVHATGRTWVTVCASIMTLASLLVPISLFLGWFIKQTDWETTKQSAVHATRHLSTLANAVFLGKLTLVVTVSSLSIQKGILAYRDIAIVTTVWLITCITTGLLFDFLIPYPGVTWKHGIITMMLILPLGRWLAVPLAVHWNRHR